MKARLYAIPASHPSFAAQVMLERKGIQYSRVDLPQWFHRGALRALRFPGTTVPALVLEGRRVQTSKAIARLLDEVQPEPRLVPADPAARAQVEEIETWADGDLQQMCRRLVYWALPRHREAVDSYLEGSKMLLPRFMVKPLAPAVIRILARGHAATDDAVRADLAALPGILDRIDGWIADGVIGGAQPNVADLQVATSLALLMTHDDLRPFIEDRPGGKLARRLTPGYPGRMPAAFPAEWLSALTERASSPAGGGTPAGP
jgi:glutathione S-transferase